MNIKDVIRQDDVLLQLESNCMRKVFADLSEHLATTYTFPQRDLYDALNQRERLGSTAVGEGVIIPHTRLDGVPKVVGVFARLLKPIDVGALDDKKADLVMMLVAPSSHQSEHMKVLSRITRVLRDQQNRDALRQTESRGDVYDILTSCD